MRTQAEVKARFDERKPNDPLGFEISEYVDYMSFEDARPFFKDEVPDEKVRECLLPLERDSIIKVMHDYMEFAWGKANDCRGISANRSILHCIAWIWLAGDTEFAAEVDRMMNEEYQHYGKEILVAICEKYGWDYSEWDDGVRTNSEI